MSCFTKHDISSHFLRISSREYRATFPANEWKILPYPTDFLHVENSNFYLVSWPSMYAGIIIECTVLLYSHYPEHNLKKQEMFSYGQ